jgi:hypothetical protein
MISEATEGVIIYFLPSAAWRILIILLAFVVSNERLEASIFQCITPPKD